MITVRGTQEEEAGGEGKKNDKKKGSQVYGHGFTKLKKQ